MNRQITCVIVFALVGLLRTRPLNTTAAAGTGGNEPVRPHVIYINWDAFRRDYYDWANQPGKPGTPNLNYPRVEACIIRTLLTDSLSQTPCRPVL